MDKKPEGLSNTLLYYLDRFKMAEHTFMVIVAVFIGLITGYGALGLRYLIHLIQMISLEHVEYSLKILADLPWYQKLLMPAIGGLLVGPIVTFFSKEVKGHGVPEVMESILLRNGMIRPRVVFAKILASSICIGSGGSSGREGPIVQIGSAIGSTLGQWLQVSPEKMRTLVAAGAAGGIAAAFNAPVAGALFAIEIIFSDFGVMRFSPIVISSVTATVVSRHYLGNFPAFVVPKYALISPWELLFYAGMGILVGLAGILFIRLLYKLEDVFDGWKFPGYLKPTIGGFLVGAIGILYPQVFGVGYEGINEALHGNLTWEFLVLLLILKILATSFTLGSGGSGGIFAPSLFMGAMIGGAIGTIVHQFFPDITATSGAYSLVGMGAFVGAVTHAPITAIIIIFEMTNDYTIILPLMIATIIAVVFTTKLQSESIYTLKLVRRGIKLFKGKEINILRSLKVQDILKTDLQKIKVNTRFKDLIPIVLNSDHEVFYLIDDDDYYIGYITMNSIRNILEDPNSVKHVIVAYDLMTPDSHFVTPEINLDDVMKIFGHIRIGELPVVDSQNKRKLLGYITRKDVIESYNKEIAKSELTHGLKRAYSSLAISEVSELIDGFFVAEFAAPRRFVGKSLSQLDLRHDYNVQIMFVKREDKRNKEIRIVPDADYTINEKDVIIFMGKEEDLERVRKL